MTTLPAEITALLDCLDGVEETGPESWKACCPAHARSRHQRPPRPRAPSPRPRSQVITPPAPHTAAPMEPQAQHGLPALPVYVEPALSPRSRPDLAERFPLVLTNAKRPQYMHSQLRGLPSLRKIAPNPTAEIHPDTARRCGIASGEWIVVETPSGRVRAQAQITDAILPGVVCCSHGWWEACPELGLPGFDPFSEAGANQNLLVHNDQHDPVSGGTPHRSTLCRVVKAPASS